MRYLKSYKLFESFEYNGMISIDTCVDIFFEIIEEEQCQVLLERRIISVGKTEIIQKEEYEINSSTYELKGKTDRVLQEHPESTEVSNIATDVFDINYGSAERAIEISASVRKIKSKLESLLQEECSVTVSQNQLNTIISIVYPVGTINVNRD